MDDEKPDKSVEWPTLIYEEDDLGSIDGLLWMIFLILFIMIIFLL